MNNDCIVVVFLHWPVKFLWIFQHFFAQLKQSRTSDNWSKAEEIPWSSLEISLFKQPQTGPVTFDHQNTNCWSVSPRQYSYLIRIVVSNLKTFPQGFLEIRCSRKWDKQSENITPTDCCRRRGIKLRSEKRLGEQLENLKRQTESVLTALLGWTNQPTNLRTCLPTYVCT